jgi:transcriptional regulator with XRE-family HTH domain
MVLLRHMLGDALRRLRLRQGRTLREVSAAARVSLGYLSEVERGQKEASSELLASICGALGAPLSQVLREVSEGFALAELQSEPVYAGPVEPAIERRPVPAKPQEDGTVPAASLRRAVPAGARLAQSAGQRMVVGVPPRKLAVGPGRQMIRPAEPVLERVPITQGDDFDELGRRDTTMVPV